MPSVIVVVLKPSTMEGDFEPPVSPNNTKMGLIGGYLGSMEGCLGGLRIPFQERPNSESEIVVFRKP